ncbi:MAG: glycerophosphodiester phosphodiesterase [Clostridia bacterium]|nr:glycerophosphodiester phosphodiesterase [Clostridia bacterium]
MIPVFVILIILLLLAALYVFLTMPRIKDHADMDLLCTDYAHRGLWDAQVPENSMTAFYLAVQQGYGIELDVRLTRDGEAVIFHDENCKRMCGVDNRIRNMTLDEVKQLTLLNTEERIPTLSEVLEMVDGKVPLLIELKGGGVAVPLCRRTSAILDSYHGAFSIESFNPKLLRWFKQYRPRYARGQLLTRVDPGKTPGAPDNALICFALSHMLLNVLSRPDFIAVDGKCMREPSLRLLGLLFQPKIFVWTVRTPKQDRACHSRKYLTIFEHIRPER